ncbi:hypothetical protein EXU57_15420 [Segetibacter sp. 3557_3]|uniref:hypothetical protein n=1 Tax=Segetibacter sp. 3557_3 TaxID=2547429 RepID=UPI001058DDF9|nr:hypothetical protein [Segetibacter sp. 3557_3]TDH24202.1 hypothetical protein EXU57_15420 [Segetibacter sp. 3557_3]
MKRVAPISLLIICCFGFTQITEVKKKSCKYSGNVVALVKENISVPAAPVVFHPLRLLSQSFY